MTSRRHGLRAAQGWAVDADPDPDADADADADPWRRSADWRCVWLNKPHFRLAAGGLVRLSLR